MALVQNSPSRLRRLMGVLLVALVAYGVDPVVSTAHAETCYPDGSGNQFCVDVANTDLVQLSPTPMFAMNDAEYTALRHLEDQSVGAVRARHGLTDTGDERVLTYLRSPLRAELLGQVLAAAGKDPGARNADEQAVLAWYGKVRQRMNVDAAAKAVHLYSDFYGDAEPGEFPDNACTFTAPAPFGEDYPGQAGRWIGCFGTPPVGDLGPRIPTFEDFTKWGLAVSVTEQANTGSSALSTLLARDAIALAAASSVAAIAAVGVALIEAFAANAVATFFLPFASLAASVTASATAAVPAAATAYLSAAALETAASAGSAAAGGAAEAAVTAAGFSVGLAAAVVTTIIVALTILIITSINITRVGQLQDDLLANLFKAATTPVDPVSDLHTDSGLQALATTIQAVTVSSNLPATPQPPVDAADPVFRITSAQGNPAPGRSDTWTYVGSPSPDGVYREGTTAIRSGWLAAPDGARDPATAVSMPLWDPEGGISPRAGFDHDAVVSTVMVGGQRKFLATAMGREGYPKTGTQCADYHEDGCWVTDKLPFLGTAGVADRRYVELVPESPPAVLIGGGGSVAQRATLPLAAVAENGTAVDPDGDPVTYTWQVTGCPIFATDCDTAPRTGATQSYVFPTRGDYTMQLTATDSLGRSDVETRIISVTNAPPALTATTGPSVLEGEPARLTGSVVDGLGEPVSVSVDWGDGSPPSTAAAVSLSGVLDYDLSHTYAEPGPGPHGAWDVVATASDGTATRDVLRTITVGNRPPSLTVDDPPGPSTYEPGDTVVLTGSADDFGPAHPLALEARWYDGTVQPVEVPEAAPRTWSTQHVVTAALSDPATPLVTLVLTDRFGATDEVAVVGGVLNRAPSFTGPTATSTPVARTVTTLSGQLTDPNGDAVGLVVDWGDGTAPDEFDRVAGEVDLQLSHTFQHRGIYTVELTATDTFGLSRTVTVELRVAGDRPLVTGTSWRDGAPFEGEFATLKVEVGYDPDRDPGDAILHWGDGTASAVSVPAGVTAFSAVHRYADDGLYDIDIELTDADGSAPPFVAKGIVVQNLSPTARLDVTDQLGRPIAPGASVPVGSRVSVATRADDPGVDDELTGQLTWGDGRSVRVLAARERQRHEHLYLTPANGIALDVSDGDGGHGLARAALPVLAPRAQSRQLATLVDGRARRLLARPARRDVAFQDGLVTAARLLRTTARQESLSVGLLAVSAARLEIAAAEGGTTRARRLLAKADHQLGRLRPVAAATSARAAVAALDGRS